MSESSRIHHAVTALEGETQHWVSLDGEHWLPVTRAPVPGDQPDDVARLLEGDGYGNFMPMTFTRRWLEREGAVFV